MHNKRNNNYMQKFGQKTTGKERNLCERGVQMIEDHE
jgi:hypothetical protein